MTGEGRPLLAGDVILCQYAMENVDKKNTLLKLTRAILCGHTRPLPGLGDLAHVLVGPGRGQLQGEAARGQAQLRFGGQGGAESLGVEAGHRPLHVVIIPEAASLGQKTLGWVIIPGTVSSQLGGHTSVT